MSALLKAHSYHLKQAVERKANQEHCFLSPPDLGGDRKKLAFTPDLAPLFFRRSGEGRGCECVCGEHSSTSRIYFEPNSENSRNFSALYVSEYPHSSPKFPTNENITHKQQTQPQKSVNTDKSSRNCRNSKEIQT